MFINAPTDSLTLADSWERVDRDLLDRFAKAPAANIGDVFDRLLVMDGGIRPFTSSTRLVGSALPIHTRAGDNLAIHRALDDAQPGDVLVINGQGDLSRALIGDLIGEIMVNKGVLGAVIDGAVRDAETLAAQGLVVFARAATPAGPYKHGPGLNGYPGAGGAGAGHPGAIVAAAAGGIAGLRRDRTSWGAGRVTMSTSRRPWTGSA